MLPVTLSDAQWRKILPFLLAHPKLHVGPQWSCRRFLSAVLWVSRSGAQWRLLPAEYGHWNSVYKRFSRWCEQGIWEGLHQHCAGGPDLEHLIIDSTIIRAHPCAAGALKKTRRSGAASVRS
jgi:transposase